MNFAHGFVHSIRLSAMLCIFSISFCQLIYRLICIIKNLSELLNFWVFFRVIYCSMLRLWLPGFLGIWESVCSNPNWEQVSMFIDYVYRFLRGFSEYDPHFCRCRLVQYWIHRLGTLAPTSMTYFAQIQPNNLIFSFRFLHVFLKIYHFRWAVFQEHDRKTLIQYMLLHY